MADNIFEILLKYTHDPAKAREATAEIKKLEDQTKSTTQTAVKGEQEVQKETDKTTDRKKLGREALKGLAAEYPQLARAAQIALSPITLAIAAISAAVTIQINKSREWGAAMSGVQLPDLTEDYVSRVHRLAEGFAKLKTGTEGISTNLSLFQKEVDANAAMLKALGIDVGTAPGEVKAAAASADAERLARSGAAKLAAAGNISANNPAAGGQAEIIATALKERDLRDARIADLNAFISGEGSAAIGAAKFLYRYGISDPRAALETEQAARGQAQAQIEGATANINTRAKRLALRQQGLDQLAEAERIQSGNVDLRRSLPAQTAQQIKSIEDQMTAEGIGTTAQMIELQRLWVQLYKQIEQANRETRALLNTQSQRQ